MGNEDLTIFVGNLHEKVTEEILYELFLQAGPMQDVRIPSHNGVSKNYGFVEYKHEISVPYALLLLDGTKLFDRQLMLNSRSNCLSLFRPPPQFMFVNRHPVPPQVEEDSSSPLRGLGSNDRKRFSDRSMMPGGGRKGQKVKDNSPPGEKYSSLRLGGSSSGRFSDNSMLPSSRNHGRNHELKRGDDSPPPPGYWSAKNYPSQSNESKMNDRAHQSHHTHHHRSQNNLKPHRKTPYDRNQHHRFDSHSSQRSHQHRYTH